jgi:hypothetical protein
MILFKIIIEGGLFIVRHIIIKNTFCLFVCIWFIKERPCTTYLSSLFTAICSKEELKSTDQLTVFKTREGSINKITTSKISLIISKHASKDVRIISCFYSTQSRDCEKFRPFFCTEIPELKLSKYRDFGSKIHLLCKMHSQCGFVPLFFLNFFTYTQLA